MRRLRWPFLALMLVILSNALQWSLVRVQMRARAQETVRIMESGTRAMVEAQVVLDEMRAHLVACRAPRSKSRASRGDDRR